MTYIDSPFHSVHHTTKSIYSCQSFFSSIHQSSPVMMVPEMEKPKVTEIMVRMDCNGCVQKVKKALHGITGIYDMYVDFPQQKLTVIGWADPEKIVKAIKKTRKTAIICSHTEQQPDEPPEQEPDGGAPPPEGEAPPPESNSPPTEPPQTEAAPPPESQNQPPPPPPEADNPPPENEPAHDNASQHNEPSRPRDREEIHVVYHHPPDSGYRYPYGHYVQQMGSTYREMPPQQHQMPPQMPQQPQPFYVTHSYNSYRPSPYVTEYAYPQSPPQYSYYSRPEPYSQVYYNGYSGTSSANGNGNGNITSMFSEENPNACTIV